jgi:hypothetical protein
MQAAGREEAFVGAFLDQSAVVAAGSDEALCHRMQLPKRRARACHSSRSRSAATASAGSTLSPTFSISVSTV